MYEQLITVLVPTSPIPSHPSTEIISKCLDGIRANLPKSQIIVMADGIREQVLYRAKQYRGFLENLPGQLDSNTRLITFEDHMHQAEMTFRTLKEVKTPLVLFVEHDAVLRHEPPIEWLDICDLLMSGRADMVRFYLWEQIWHEHEYLMAGELRHNGVRFVKTRQYSQWPLICTKEYHQRILDPLETRKTMIEPAVYGQVYYGGWEKNKIVIYAPPNMLTFRHLNGRCIDEATGKRDPADW